MRLDDLAYRGVQVGLGIAIVPAAVTTLIATSKFILVNIIANLALRILSFNSVQIAIATSLIEVPLLWKISKITAMVGATVVAISLTAGLINKLYKKYKEI